MLIKIGNKWVNANNVTGLDWVCNMVNGEKTYFLYIRNDGEDCCCGGYNTEEGVIKAMDEAANKINAAQGYKDVERDEEKSELMKAAEKIKAYCENRKGCIGCHFRGKDGMCLVVDNVPSQWE